MFDVLPDDFTYVLNFAVVHSWTPDFEYDLAVNAEGTGGGRHVYNPIHEDDVIARCLASLRSRMFQP